MTRDQLKVRVKDNLYDAGMVNFTSETLDDSLQDGYDEVALLTQCIEKIATVNFQANLTYYNFATLISDYYRVIAIWNNNTKRWLEPLAYGELNEHHGRWETINGEPAYFAMLGWEYIALYRKLASATGSMLVFYKAQADVLGGSTIADIPPAQVNILENYSTSDLLDQHLEYTKSLAYFEKYAIQVKDIVKEVNRRNLSDRLLFLAEVIGAVEK